jgi:Na+-transporting methylmalonyl-CoA/oxaloacetate decarboxylase gamma subunit
MEGLSGGIIVAIVDFLMVFIVLGGLASVLVALRKFVQIWEQPAQETTPSEIPGESSAPHLETSQEQQTHASCVAAITAAIQEFTALPEGAFRIDYIEPLAEVPSVVTYSQIAAITAAIQQFTGLPEGAFRIDYIDSFAEAPFSSAYANLAGITAAIQAQTSLPSGAFRIEYIEPVNSVAQQPHIIAIAAAMHEYLSTPRGIFRIIKRHPLGMANTWKMAGRLELMEFDSD